MPFSCNICEEESTRICASCTKDTCSNHLCDRCGRCSDCCDCEVKLEERPTVQEAGFSVRHNQAATNASTAENATGSKAVVHDGSPEGSDDELLTDMPHHNGHL